MSVELALGTLRAWVPPILPGTPDARELHARGFDDAAVHLRVRYPLETLS